MYTLMIAYLQTIYINSNQGEIYFHYFFKFCATLEEYNTMWNIHILKQKACFYKKLDITSVANEAIEYNDICVEYPDTKKKDRLTSVISVTRIHVTYSCISNLQDEDSTPIYKIIRGVVTQS